MAPIIYSENGTASLTENEFVDAETERLGPEAIAVLLDAHMLPIRCRCPYKVGPHWDWVHADYRNSLGERERTPWGPCGYTAASVLRAAS